MNYYIRAWVLGGEIVTVNSNTNQITHDAVTIEGADIYDLIVNGDYLDAGTVFGVLTFDGKTFTGLDVDKFIKRG